MMHKFSIDTKHPFAEIGFMIAMTFIPILVAALFATANADGNYFVNFLGFFGAGELGLYILSLCGTIGWLIVQTKLNMNGENYWLVGLLIVLILMAAGTIGTNPKFDENLAWFLHIALALAYFAAILGWYGAIKLRLAAESKYEKASRKVGKFDQKQSEQDTIEKIIGATDE